MKITLAFKESQGDIVDKLIAWWTDCKYTHVEMIIKDKWISSNPVEGEVYIRKLRDLKDNWAYIDVNIDGRRIPTTMKFIESQVGKDYDYNGILWAQFFNITRGQHQNKWFCSELVAEILKKLGSREINLQSAKYSPADLWNIFRCTELTEPTEKS